MVAVVPEPTNPLVPPVGDAAATGPVIDLTDGATADLAALPNPLDGQGHNLLRIAGDLGRCRRPSAGRAAAGSGPDASAHPSPVDADPMLAALRQVLDAEAAFIVGVRAGAGATGVVLGSASSAGDATQRLAAPDGEGLRRLLRLAVQDRRGVLGFSAEEAGRPGRSSMVVPLRNDGNGRLDALVVHRLPDALTGGLGEALATMVRAFLDSDGEADPEVAELRVLNQLRRRSRMPLAVHDRAFELFRRQLDRVHMVFEPMVTLGTSARHVEISGWEALARIGHGGDAAPQALFDTAAVWGDQFVFELDGALADRALERFVAAWEASGLAGALPPLSINVSPRSVWSDGYVQRLQESMRRHDVGLGRLTLELSEKDPIVLAGSDLRIGDTTDAMALFRRRLDALAQRLEISFAIDDFGAGHSSLDRLSSLDLSHVKVDRAILHHPDAELELRFVLALAQRRRMLDKVIIEGVDEQCPLGLHQLWAIGVRRIQGYITERGTDRLGHLRPETTARLAALVTGPPTA